MAKGKGVSVGRWVSAVFSVKPHVSIRVDDNSARLSPTEARRLAIELLTAAEDVEQGQARSK